MFTDLGGSFFFDDDEERDRIAAYLGLEDEETTIMPDITPPWKTSQYAPTPTAKPKGRNAMLAEIAVEPKQQTVWDVAIGGVGDMRCQFREVHVHSILHALGINPQAPWPPSSDLLMQLLVPRADMEVPAHDRL